MTTPDTAATFRNQRLNELAALAQDWDSYGAGPIDRAALRTADALTFVPSPHGGIQIVLHAGGIELEIEIASTGKVDEVNVRPT